MVVANGEGDRPLAEPPLLPPSSCFCVCPSQEETLRTELAGLLGADDLGEPRPRTRPPRRPDSCLARSEETGELIPLLVKLVLLPLPPPRKLLGDSVVSTSTLSFN